MNLKGVLANPAIKTLVSNGVGIISLFLVSAISGQPTGGFLAYLNAHPDAAVAYIAVQQLAHNFLSKYAPPTNVMSTPSSTQTAPNAPAVPAPKP